MRTLFQYRDWSAPEGAMEALDARPVHAFNSQTVEALYAATCCPAPYCRWNNRYGLNACGMRGPVLTEYECGSPTSIALPCEKHQDFSYPPGWYIAWYDSMTATAGACQDCGARYTACLWGHGGENRCPECTCQNMVNQDGKQGAEYGIQL